MEKNRTSRPGKQKNPEAKTRIRAVRKPLPRTRKKAKTRSLRRKATLLKSEIRLELESLQVAAKCPAELGILQRDFDGGFQESEFVARVVRNSLINVGPQAVLARENAQRVRQLDFVGGAGFGALQTIENRGRQNVAAGDGKIRRGVFRLRFFH